MVIVRRVVVYLLIISSIVVGFEFASCAGNESDANVNRDHLCTMMGRLGVSDTIQELVGEGNALWRQKNISVYFLDNDGGLEAEILKTANEWMPYSGIRFVKSWNQNTSDVRVSTRTGGWWSYIGSESLHVGKDSVTLSLQGLYKYGLLKRRSVILHEFGHCLGLLHEHQHPFFTINWNYDSLYSYYNQVYNVGKGWVDSNVLVKYSSLSGIYCEPDKNSIMMYAIPKGLTVDGFEVKEPTSLSILDKKYINLMYFSHEPCK